MATNPPRRIISAGATVSVVPEDSTAFLTRPSTFRGDQTFSALGAVRNSISTSGGWAQLAGTTLKTAYPTNAEVDAISPQPVLRGTTFPAHMTSVWGSAAFNGYGFFIGAVGAHYAYWGNDMYMVRVADPVGVARLYDPAPIQAVAYRYDAANGQVNYPQSNWLVPRSAWPSLATSEVNHSFPEWGPKAVHQYDAMEWDAAGEFIILGGSNQNSCANATESNVAGVLEHNIWKFSVNAPTPKAAWTKAKVGDASAGIFGLVDNADRTYSFRRNDNTRWTLTPSTMAITSGVPVGPKAERYTAWRPCFRDGAEYYEIHRTELDTPAGTSHSIFRTTSGSYVKVADLPVDYRGSRYSDVHGGVAVVNGCAYLWSANSTVIRVNLLTGAVDTYTDATAITQPTAGYRGVWGRWAWVPQAGCFVGVSSEATDVYVFRPPSAWNI